MSENSQKTPVPESPATLLKKTLAQVFSCEFSEISKNTFFTEHVWTTASVSGIHPIMKTSASLKLIVENIE